MGVSGGVYGCLQGDWNKNIPGHEITEVLHTQLCPKCFRDRFAFAEVALYPIDPCATRGTLTLCITCIPKTAQRAGQQFRRQWTFSSTDTTEIDTTKILQAKNWGGRVVVALPTVLELQ